MESILALWNSDYRKNIALVTNTICEKARKLYGKFTDGGDDDPDDPEPGPSTASPTKPTGKGSFDKFQKRFNLKSVSLLGEATSAEEDVNETFKTIVEERGYSQVLAPIHLYDCVYQGDTFEQPLLLIIVR
ncbi:Hypothetical predicted protein [Octopus vulgaris]|uniref:Uncharacterized protein n=1 Tax=Octopus vulgaris TaxID=6645 RepID=A0AA36BCH8_OCTVU|nr:Hypothetical predicted protein [Octopus vulgaris]